METCSFEIELLEHPREAFTPDTWERVQVLSLLIRTDLLAHKDSARAPTAMVLNP